MCIAVFMWEANLNYPFLLLFNRDEYHSRPTEPLEWWDGGGILGGRDVLAGGTWLASSKDGRLAFVTNVREEQLIDQAMSRGHLPVRFLESKKSPLEFAKEVVAEADQYNGFNLVLADFFSKSLVYVTNRPKDGNFISEVSPGIHVLTNASLDSPWPKAQRLHHNFRELLAEYGEDELPTKEMVSNLLTDTTKDNESMFPGVLPPELEYQLSSIYVDVKRPQGNYGTRNQSAVSVNSNGEVCFYERFLEKDNLWKEQTVSFQIAMKM